MAKWLYFHLRGLLRNSVRLEVPEVLSDELYGVHTSPEKPIKFHKHITFVYLFANTKDTNKDPGK